MLKNTPPATACTNKSSSTCLKSALASGGKAPVNCVKNTVPMITKSATNNNTCTKSSLTITKRVPDTCTKNTNNCLNQQNGTCTKNATKTITITNSVSSTTNKTVSSTTAQTATIPAKCPNAKTPNPSVLRNMAASNQTAASTNASTNSTTTVTTNGTATTCPNAGAKVENSELRIIIIDENWSQYCYRIKINTPFGKLINRFCQQVRKIDHKSVLFWYHGRLVEDDDTPKTLNIKDGEVILAHYIK